MKYTAQFIIPSLGKTEKYIAMPEFKDKIRVPLFARHIGTTPLSELDLEYNAIRPQFKVMEFIFNGHKTPDGFECDNKGNWKPTRLICEYEFNGIKEV